MLSSCRLAHSPAYASGLDASYIQVSQQVMMPWEGRKEGRNLVPGTWLHSVTRHQPGGWHGGCSPQGLLWLTPWAPQLLGTQLSSSAHLHLPSEGSDQQGASLVEGIHRWALTATAPRSAWTVQGHWTGSENVCRYTLSALNLESTFNKIHPSTAAQEAIVLISNATLFTYRKLQIQKSKFHCLYIS